MGYQQTSFTSSIIDRDTASGVNGLDVGQYSTPPLTAGYIGREEIGRLCLRAIVRQLDDDMSAHPLVASHLLVRESTVHMHLEKAQPGQHPQVS
jgi:hypothetical protein